MTELNSNLNQTQFSAEEPIFEVLPKDELPVLTEPKQNWWQKQAKGTKILIIILGLLLVVLGLVALFAPRTQPEITVGTTPIQEKPAELGPIEQKLQFTEQLLKSADSTARDFPFPPVTKTLRIDDVR